MFKLLQLPPCICGLTVSVLYCVKMFVITSHCKLLLNVLIKWHHVKMKQSLCLLLLSECDN